jgi:hypothetical protein
MLHQSVAEILAEHVSFELESIDRMYLNGYVPSLPACPECGGRLRWIADVTEPAVIRKILLHVQSRAPPRGLPDGNLPGADAYFTLAG